MLFPLISIFCPRCFINLVSVNYGNGNFIVAVGYVLRHVVFPEEDYVQMTPWPYRMPFPGKNDVGWRSDKRHTRILNKQFSFLYLICLSQHYSCLLYSRSLAIYKLSRQILAKLSNSSFAISFKNGWIDGWFQRAMHLFCFVFSVNGLRYSLVHLILWKYVGMINYIAFTNYRHPRRLQNYWVTVKLVLHVSIMYVTGSWNVGVLFPQVDVFSSIKSLRQSIFA